MVFIIHDCHHIIVSLAALAASSFSRCHHNYVSSSPSSRPLSPSCVSARRMVRRCVRGVALRRVAALAAAALSRYLSIIRVIVTIVSTITINYPSITYPSYVSSSSSSRPVHRRMVRRCARGVLLSIGVWCGAALEASRCVASLRSRRQRSPAT